MNAIDTDQVRRFCPAGHIYQLKPMFERCCAEAQEDPYTKPQRLNSQRRVNRLNPQRRAWGGRRPNNSTPWLRIRALIRLRDGGLCRYCGEPGYEVDHVVPHSKRGDAESFDNLVWSCGPCNRFKGAERGFLLKNNVLRWHDNPVSEHGLFGARLMEAIATQRLARQTRQGLVGMLQFKTGGGIS